MPFSNGRKTYLCYLKAISKSYKPIDWIINHKEWFFPYETKKDRRLAEQLLDQTWGGNMEIAAMSEMYNIAIKVWELSSSGNLIASFDNTSIVKFNRHQALHLVRHRKVHFDSLIPKIKVHSKLPHENNSCKSVFQSSYNSSGKLPLPEDTTSMEVEMPIDNPPTCTVHDFINFNIKEAITDITQMILVCKQCII